MRIISGDWRGRRLPKIVSGTRPTPDRAREALLSILYSKGVIFSQMTALDLFCGSGSVGLELLSRGAKHVGFVDKNRKVLASIDDFLDQVDARDRGTTVPAIFPENSLVLKTAVQHTPCDVIFADPPFSAPVHPAVLLKDPVIDDLLAPGGWVIWEQESHQDAYEPIEGWSTIDSRKYGRIRLYFYQRA